MNKFFFILISVFFLFGGNCMAAPISYEEYQKDAKLYCEDGKPWYAESTRNTQKLTYPKLDSNSINTWINTQRSQSENEPPILRERLLAELDPVRIGSIDGIKVLEVAQIAYHARMNTIFDCAVIESRKDILASLKKIMDGQSEILEKIKKEEFNLNQKSKQCIPKNTSTTKQESNSDITTKRLIDTTVLHYCHYRKYLTYLESNLEEDIDTFDDIEGKIGENNTHSPIRDTDTLEKIINKKRQQIQTEIYIADRAIPRAILAYKEMERTYATHILLVVIYDEYVRLRDNLARYMSSTSQLFEKANNAMSP